MDATEQTALDILDGLSSYGINISTHVVIVECLLLMILATLIANFFILIAVWRGHK